MSARSVVVTGTGMISALGRSVPSSLEALRAGTTAGPVASPVPTTLDPPFPAFTVPWDPGRDDPMLSRTSRLALAAVDEALEASGLDLDAVDRSRVGVCLGTSVGCSFNSESFWRDHLGHGSPDVSVVDRYYGNDLSTLVSARLGASGPASTVVNACASGTDAVGLACQWIACGLCDVVVAGGADHIERFGYHGFVSLKNMSPTRCRPFDRNRDGLSLGEGAGALVLELEEHASRRRARPLGVVLGYASAADAYHPTAPHPGGRGLRRAIAGALAEAGLAIRDVGFVNAHATATIENDRVEGRVLADVLHPGTLVTCTKGYTGHTLGASGAIEAIISIENLSGGWVPASIGFEEVDPETGIEPVRSLARHGAGVALSISLAFGGTNSAIVLGAP